MIELTPEKVSSSQEAKFLSISFQDQGDVFQFYTRPFLLGCLLTAECTPIDPEHGLQCMRAAFHNLRVRPAWSRA